MLANRSATLGSMPGARESSKYSFTRLIRSLRFGSNFRDSHPRSSRVQCTAPGLKSPASTEIYSWFKISRKVRSRSASSSSWYGRYLKYGYVRGRTRAFGSPSPFMITGSPPGEVAREISCAWVKLSDVSIALGAEASILAGGTSKSGMLGPTQVRIGGGGSCSWMNVRSGSR